MLQQRRRRSRFDVGLGLAVALAGLAVASTFMACTFTPVLSEPGDLHEVLNNAPEKGLTHTQRATYLNVPGYLNVHTGWGVRKPTGARTTTPLVCAYATRP
jgi:hypothetical protein